MRENCGGRQEGERKDECSDKWDLTDLEKDEKVKEKTLKDEENKGSMTKWRTGRIKKIIDNDKRGT